jgi:hypothetical protein
VGAAMSDPLGPGSRAPGQVFLGVITLGTMSAKHTGAPGAGQSPSAALTPAFSARLPDEAP